MKKLSDYEGNEAIELWADLLKPMTKIFGDPDVANVMKSHKPPVIIAQTILESHTAEATEIMLRIDPTPINGLNLITRLVSLVMEFVNTEELRGFFPSVEPDVMESESGGSAMANTEDDGK